MTMPADNPAASRREFLTGRAALREVEAVGARTADALAESLSDDTPTVPSRGAMLRLETRAMNCEFAAILNHGPADQLLAASQALDLIHQLEDQLTVYRPHSEMSRMNSAAAIEPFEIERRLFELLQFAAKISRETDRAFDPTTGPLIALWRRCRDAGRIPTQTEIDSVLSICGVSHVLFDESAQTIRFDRACVELNLGAIGKGHALDRAGEFLASLGVDTFLLSGGQSSLMARGSHNRTGGWPVGLRNPMFPTEQMATLLLKDMALSTSGAGEQFYRLEGKRYGHILDPRTGWPAEGMLSVTVLAPTAAEADALSTAFFVGGVEIARQYCFNHREVSVLFTPPVRSGRTVEIHSLNLPPGTLFPAPGCAVIPLDAPR